MKLALLAAVLLLLVVAASSQEQKRYAKGVADYTGEGRNGSRADFGKRLGGYQNGTIVGRNGSRADFGRRVGPGGFGNRTGEGRNGNRADFGRSFGPGGFGNGTGEVRNGSRAAFGRHFGPGGFGNGTGEVRNGSRVGFGKRVGPSGSRNEAGERRNISRDETGRRRTPRSPGAEFGEGRNRSRANAARRNDASDDQAQDQVNQDGQEVDNSPRRPVNGGRNGRRTDDESPRGSRTGAGDDDEAEDEQEVGEPQKKLFRRTRSVDQEIDPQESALNLEDEAEESESNPDDEANESESNPDDEANESESNQDEEANESESNPDDDEPDPEPVLADSPTGQEEYDRVSNGDQVDEDDQALPEQAQAVSEPEQPVSEPGIRRRQPGPILKKVLTLVKQRQNGIRSTEKPEEGVNQRGEQNGPPQRKFIPPSSFLFSRPQPADGRNATSTSQNLVRNEQKIPVSPSSQNILQKIQNIKDAARGVNQGESRKSQAQLYVSELFKNLSPETQEKVKNYLAALPRAQPVLKPLQGEHKFDPEQFKSHVSQFIEGLSNKNDGNSLNARFPRRKLSQ